MQNTFDKNTIIGIVLMVLIMVGYTYYTLPSKEELAERKRLADSTAVADSLQKISLANTATNADSLKTAEVIEQLPDSVRDERLKNALGAFAGSAIGEQEFYTLENDKLIMKVSSKGGRVYSVQLKNYKTYDDYIAKDSVPLVLFDGDTNTFSLTIPHGNRQIPTGELYFKPTGGSVLVSGKDSASLSMRLLADNGGYVEYLYQIHGDDYMVDFNINLVGLDGVIDKGSALAIDWTSKLPKQEKSLKHERQNSTVYYKLMEDDDVDCLSESSSDEEETIDQKTQWIAFKQKFFSSILIYNDGFEAGSKLKESYQDENEEYVKDLSANFSLASGKTSYDMSFYFGPNKYTALKKYKLDLEKVVYLGWAIFGWINRFAVIPVFNLLDSFNLNYGIIILILTILLKIVLLPIAYNSYMSSAKQKVLKPEITELNKKYEGKDAMEKQQATMALYRKAGVNPLAGCIPALLQMPIIYALFNFFPNSIELRQQPFLWAEDLSTYDAIFTWTQHIPLISATLGNHISLFTVLMTISTVLYTRMNSSLMGSPGGNDAMAKQMKIMMYIMPVMFLGILNSYPCGLSYYYLLANLITFGQQFIFTKLVDEDAIHAKIEANKKKPKKESSFQKRLEEMAKQQGVKTPRKERRKDDK